MAVLKDRCGVSYGVKALDPIGATFRGWHVRCGAKNKRGRPCKQHHLYANGRCLYHGGPSTGPITPEGKARALANLKQYAAKAFER